eukprot:scaffold79521_cov33-Prasinocladus_malaysianus.AAC.1
MMLGDISDTVCAMPNNYGDAVNGFIIIQMTAEIEHHAEYISSPLSIYGRRQAASSHRPNHAMPFSIR